MSNTLLGYFKNALKAEGYSAKYLNRDFLAKYITAYNERGRNIKRGIFYEYGAPEYEYNKVFTTDFYTKNSGSYTRFIEHWHGYKKGMALLDKALCSKDEAAQIARNVAGIIHDERERAHYNGY